jgi:4-hydroxy-tetrahydrodipicolinate reductase
MGKALIRLAAAEPSLQVVAAVSRSGDPAADASIPALRADAVGDWPAFDVAVDFSLPDGFDRLLDACRQRGAALVSGTTGLEGRQLMHLAEASSDIPVLWASNFSLGVVVLHELVRQVSESLPAWTVAITETHHVHKLDAPSGTALTLGEAASAANGRETSIDSIRQGEVIGEHVVRFSGLGETLELAHRADDRDIFARGALEAARRLAQQPAGQFSLAQLLALES